MPQTPTAVLGVTGGRSDFPKSFGNLTLLKPLAHDERGEVFIGLRAEGVDRLCIVKLIAPRLLEDPAVWASLRAEAGWLVARVHGNLVQTYDVGQASERLFFVNELIEGRDLGALLARPKEGPPGLPTAVAVYMVLELVAAVEFIRSTEERVTGVPTSLAGLSAADVLMSREGTIKLLHSGSCLARRGGGFGSDDAPVASLVAPEHVGGGGSMGGDIYAVGALLWQSLTGRPLAGDNALAHLDGLRAGTFLPESPAKAAGRGDIPEALDQLVMSMLARKPADRPASYEALRADLVAILKSVGQDGPAATKTLMAKAFGKSLAAEAAELAKLQSIADRESTRLGPKVPTATLTNFEGSGRAVSRSDESDLALGEVIPGTRYRALAKLGEGGMGAVYAAEHVDIEKKVALKIVHADLLVNPVVLGQFRQEARAASRIGNPYICDVTDWGELADGRVFFVMEFLDGPSLGRVLKEKRRVPPARCVPILRQVCKALGSAHEKGIVHLDVKPDNVLLIQREGRGDAVKVVDFGVAGILGQATGSVKVMGTPEYMAPERATGQHYDHRSDIYSLGVMAYEMIVGEVPLQGASPIETLALQATEAPDKISERLTKPVPEAIEAVVMRMLEKDPAKRPQSMAEAEALLCEAQVDAGIRTPWDDHLPLPAIDPDRAARLARKMSASGRRTRVMAGVMTGVAALSVTISYFLFRESDRPEMPPAAKAAPAAPPKRQGPVVQFIPAPPPPAAPAPAPVVTTTPTTAAPVARGVAARPPVAGRKNERPATEPTAPREPKAVAAARSAMESGQYKYAEQVLNDFMAVEPLNARALGLMAEVMFEQSRYREALNYSRQAANLAPRQFKNLLFLAQSHYKLGNLKESLDAYERAQKISPQDEGVARRVTELRSRLGK